MVQCGGVGLAKLINFKCSCVLIGSNGLNTLVMFALAVVNTLRDYSFHPGSIRLLKLCSSCPCGMSLPTHLLVVPIVGLISDLATYLHVIQFYSACTPHAGP